jgi:hypothetical protein
MMQSNYSIPIHLPNYFIVKSNSYFTSKNHFVKFLFLFLLFLCFNSTERLNAQWIQQGADIDGDADFDFSGTSISISSDGSIVAIGAYNNAGGGIHRGQVRVYKNISGAWTQQGTYINGKTNGEESGRSVSLSSDGSIVAFSAIHNDGGGVQRGQVRVYKNISGVWTQQGADIDGEADSDISGTSVSLSSDGSIVAIGAINNDGGGPNRGHVRVYKNISGVWTQQGADIDGEADNDYSGTSVSLSGDGSIVAIGARYNDAGGTDRGQVRVYKNISGIWTQQGADIDGEADTDNSGHSVSLSTDGSIVAIGEPNNDGGGPNRGQVRIYKNISGVWTQQGVDIEGEADDDQSGVYTSLSSTGSIVAIGAYSNDAGGTDKGHVRIYKNISGVWTQQGADIDGEADSDFSGYSVSLSFDGDIVAIGANSNDAGGIDRGHVRVYKYCPNIYNTTDMVYYCSLEDALAGASSGDVIQIAAGTYSSPCFTIDESVTLTPVGGAVILDCLTMNGSGKIMEMGGNLTINNLTLTTGKISTNGFNLSAGTITGGDPATYIITD